MIDFKARQTLGNGGSVTIDQNFKDIETAITALVAADPQPSVTSVTKDYGASVNDVNIFARNTITVTLADASKLTGRAILVKNTGSGTVTVAASRGQTVDGSPTASLAALSALGLVSDGSNWWAD